MKIFAMFAALSILTGAWLGAAQPADQVPVDTFAPHQIAQDNAAGPEVERLSGAVAVKATRAAQRI